MSILIISLLYIYCRDFFPIFLEHNPYPFNWEFQQCFVKNWEKNTWLIFCNDFINSKNYCLGWHLPSYKSFNSEVVFHFKDFRIFYSIFYFVTFSWEFFPWNWEKMYYFQLGIWPNISFKNIIPKKSPCIVKYKGVLSDAFEYC